MKSIDSLKRSVSTSQLSSSDYSFSDAETSIPKRRSGSEADLTKPHEAPVPDPPERALAVKRNSGHRRDYLSGIGVSDSLAVTALASRIGREAANVITRMEAKTLKSTHEMVRLHDEQRLAEMQEFFAQQSRCMKIVETCHRAAMKAVEQENTNLQEVNFFLQWELKELRALALRSRPMPSLKQELKFIVSTPGLQGLSWNHLRADEDLWAIGESGAVDFTSGPRSRATLAERQLHLRDSCELVVVYDTPQQSLGAALDIYELLRRGIKTLRVVLLYDWTSRVKSVPAAVLQLGAYADSLRARFAPDLEINYFSGRRFCYQGLELGTTAEQRYWDSRDDWRSLPHAIWVGPQSSLSGLQLSSFRDRLQAAGTLFVEASAHP